VLCFIVVACDSQPPDTEKPELILSGEPSRVMTVSSITLEGNVAKDVVKFVYRLNGGEAQDITATITEGVFKITLENLPVGANTVILEASDAAGNVTVSEPITFVIVDLNGVWGTHAGLFDLCGNPTINDYVLVLNMQQSGASVSGTVTAEFSIPYLQGTFSGTINNENILEAEVTFPSPVEGIAAAIGTLTFEVKEDVLEGEFVYLDGETCTANDETPAAKTVSASLVKGVEVPPLPADDGLESNDTLETATPLTALPYQSPTDLILIRDNPDWYELTLRESSVLTLSLDTVQNGSGFILELYDANGPLDTPRFPSKIPDTAVGDEVWGLAAGRYYLKVLGTPFFKEAAMPYSFLLSAEPTPDVLFEPNNTAATAYEIDALPFRGEIFLQDDDEDWFVFTLPEPADASKRMNALKFSGIVFPGMKLFSSKTDPGGKLVPDKELCRDDDFFFDLQPVPGGKYYLQIKESGTTGPFTLSFAALQKPVPSNVPELCPRPEPTPQ
jgi:hypothetical protein